MDKVCDVIIMCNRSFDIYLLVSLVIKEKKILLLVFRCVFSKEKVVVMCKNFDNFTYGLTGQAGALQNANGSRARNRYLK
jgi:hypothetical protein